MEKSGSLISLYPGGDLDISKFNGILVQPTPIFSICHEDPANSIHVIVQTNGHSWI